MKPNITNTSQTLVVNSYYGYSCSESNRYDVNKKIEEKFSPVYLMSILEDISKTLETKILHTSKFIAACLILKIFKRRVVQTFVSSVFTPI